MIGLRPRYSNSSREFYQKVRSCHRKRCPTWRNSFGAGFVVLFHRLTMEIRSVTCFSCLRYHSRYVLSTKEDRIGQVFSGMVIIHGGEFLILWVDVKLGCI
jgi:hypothetical protein